MENNVSGVIFVRGAESGDYNYPNFGNRKDSIVLGKTESVDIVLRLDCMSPLEIETLATKLAIAYNANYGGCLGRALERFES